MTDSRKVPFHDLVRRLDVRLRLLRVVRELAFVAAAVVLALVVPRLAGDGAPWLAALVAVGGVAFLIYRFVSGANLDRAAAAGDQSGGLRDELASAQWFYAKPSVGTWEAHQIARAERRADELDAAQLLPLRVPRQTIAAVVTLAAVGVVLPLAEGPLISDALRARIASSFAAGPDDDDPLADGLDTSEDAADARIETRSPEEILAELRAGELRLPEEPTDDVDALMASLTAAMEERAFTESTEEVSAALAGLAEAMDSADSLTASEWLEGLTEAMRSANTPEDLQALLESLEGAADGDPLAAAAAEMMELMEGGMSAEEAFEQLAENMQAMDGQQMGAQGQGDAQQMPFPGDGQGGGEPQAGEGGEPAAGMPQGAAGMSGQVQMVAAEGQMGAPIPMDAGPAGNMTGPGGGGESEVFGAATSLEVQLEMEAIPAPLDEEPVPEQIIERQSRREDATVAYDSVSSLSEYADETTARTRSIPTGMRPLVRAYFLMIRETATNPDTESGDPEGAEDP